jgi:hypothetical protein
MRRGKERRARPPRLRFGFVGCGSNGGTAWEAGSCRALAFPNLFPRAEKQAR